MNDDTRKTESDEAIPAGDAGAGDAAEAEARPDAASAPCADAADPPEAANDRDAPEANETEAKETEAEVPEAEILEADVPETEEIPEAGEPEAPALTEDQQRIVALETEIAELRDRALRAMAEADNAQKRAARDVSESRKYGATALARDVLSVADNLGRALLAVPDVPREDDENLFNLRTGVDMTLKEMLQALERHGVKKVTPEAGERFDHNRHQAMFEVPTDDLAPGAVAQVVQDGYVIHDRLLRPALVGVARKPPEEAPSGEAPSGEALSGEALSGEAPSGEAPSGEAPSGEAPPPEGNAEESDAA